MKAGHNNSHINRLIMFLPTYQNDWQKLYHFHEKTNIIWKLCNKYDRRYVPHSVNYIYKIMDNLLIYISYVCSSFQISLTTTSHYQMPTIFLKERFLLNMWCVMAYKCAFSNHIFANFCCLCQLQFLQILCLECPRDVVLLQHKTSETAVGM